VQLFRSIAAGAIEAIVPEVVLVEAFKQLCVGLGKDFAVQFVNSFFVEVAARCTTISKETIIEAGKLKCQHRGVLSYNDAILIATAILEKAVVHTTEKDWTEIPGLKVIKYAF
jgi:predicted nucleic acid-binding protein